MASYQKIGKTWQYNVSRMVGGKSKPIRKGGFTTKKEAQAAAAEIEDKLRKGVSPRLKLEPFDLYFENWLEVYKTAVAKNTKARYLNTLETLRGHFGGIYIQNITKRDYQAFLNAYGANKSKETVRKLNTHVRSCVRDAIDEGVISSDFTRRATFSGSVEAKREEEKHMDYFENKRFIKHLKENLATATHYLLLLASASACRFAELVGLTEEDFDFRADTLSITKTWGYTNKMHEGWGPTKNKETRVLKIDKATMNIFKAWFAVKPKNHLGLVFYSGESKYRVISNNAVNKSLKHILNELNIDPISVHGLRHTHASILLYKKVSIYYVSERLGHKDIETTMSHYAHIVKELRQEDEQRTLRIMDALA